MILESMKHKARELKKNLGLLYLAIKHPKTPWYAKVLIAVIISYALSPIDIVPDFIPVLGYLDDVVLIPAGIALAIKLIPAEVIKKCKETQADLTNIKGKGIYAGILIVLVWVLLVYTIIKYLL